MKRCTNKIKDYLERAVFVPGKQMSWKSAIAAIAGCFILTAKCVSGPQVRR